MKLRSYHDLKDDARNGRRIDTDNNLALFYDLSDDGSVYVLSENSVKLFQDDLDILTNAIEALTDFVEVQDRQYISKLRDYANHFLADVHIKKDMNTTVKKLENLMDAVYRGGYYSSRAEYPNHIKWPRFIGDLSYFQTNCMKMLFDTIQKEQCIRIILDNCNRINAKVLQVQNYKNKYHSYIHGVIENYQWNNMLNYQIVEEGSEKNEFLKEDRYCQGKVRVHMTEAQLESLMDADVNLVNANLNGKKTVINELEPVDFSEVEKAAKKISTVSDVSSMKAFKIKNGFLMKSSREVANYWEVRNMQLEDFPKLFTDISDGAYLVSINTNDKQYVSVTTSLGRSIASVSKKITNNVMDQLNLDDLI